ncbi:MAG: restriction endonuclease subunit S [Desulfurivibrionaceae bacterium]
MSGKYQKYPDYTDSHVKWLGSIPSHWPMFSGKRLFNNVRCPSLPSDEQLAASQKYGVIPQSIMMGLNDAKVMLALKGTESFRHVGKNNFVISLRSFEGGIEHSDYEGCVSPAYTVLEPAKRIYAKYYKYLLKCGPYISALQSATDSLRDGKSITFEQFSAIALVFPEYDEQRQIANFLDHETAKIDTLIDKQQQLIKLLKEKRQAVISHAVTKGLNPDAVMKDSGVEWLGEVPEHWRLIKFGHISCVVRGGSPRPAGDPTLFNGDYSPWVTVAEITKDDEIYLTKTETCLTKKGSEQCRVFSKGTLLLSNSGATLGVPKILDLNANANDGVVGFEALDGSVNIEFAYFYLSTLTEYLRESIKQGSGQPNLNTDIVKDLLIPLAPKNEQDLIVSEVDRIISKYKALLEKSEAFVVLLKERRTALISAAVTGKIDVRNWQPVQAEIPMEASA